MTFEYWWEEIKGFHEDDVSLFAKEAWDYQQARIEALEEENRMLRDAAQRRVDCGHDDECGGRQKDRCGCGHTELENALEMLLP